MRMTFQKTTGLRAFRTPIRAVGLLLYFGSAKTQIRKVQDSSFDGNVKFPAILTLSSTGSEPPVAGLVSTDGLNVPYTDKLTTQAVTA